MWPAEYEHDVAIYVHNSNNANGNTTFIRELIFTLLRSQIQRWRLETEDKTDILRSVIEVTFEQRWGLNIVP